MKTLRKRLKINKIFLGILKILIIIIIFKLMNVKSNYDLILEYPDFQIDEFKIIFDLINSRHTLDIFWRKAKIENIFILISIFPFLKNEIKITKRNPIYEFCKYLFYNNSNEVIKVHKTNYDNFTSKFDYLLNYIWETFPNKNSTNYIRHILYHFYPEECLNIYDSSLNMNIRHLIHNNIEKLSYTFISDLMSKICYYIIIKVILELLSKKNV